MLSLENILENSGDSILESYDYSGGLLTIQLDSDSLNTKVRIKIKTDEIVFKNDYLNRVEALYKTCRIEIQVLSDLLSTENGIYMPSGDFGTFMMEKRLNGHLAYGEKATVKKYIFSLVGYDRLVSFLVSYLDCIILDEATGT